MLEDLPSLRALPFFSVSSNCYYISENQKKKGWDKKYLLPTTSHLLQEEAFAKVYLSYNEEGINFNFLIQSAFEKINESYPQRGDSIELFIDTRDVKTNHYINRFCHHFVIFPEKVEKSYAKEITKFYGDDMHPLCDPSDLDIQVSIEPKKYLISLHLPKDVLYGFDPARLKRFGLNYRINRCNGSSQHFSFSSEEYPIERMPFYWASINMVSSAK